MKRYNVTIETDFSTCEYTIESEHEHRAQLRATALFLTSWPLLGKYISAIKTVEAI